MSENNDGIIKENKMGTMSIRRLVLNMAWPAILSMLMQALYNVIDTVFVSHVSHGAITAVTYVFPIQMLMIAFSVGTGVGVNSLISRRLGAKRFDDANDAASHGFRLSFVNWLIFAIFGLFFSKAFIGLYTSTPEIYDAGVSYLRIVTIGSLFIMIQVTNEKILQSTGNMIFPMISSVIGAVVNIVLDAILIFGYFGMPAMGVTGAAVATVIGQGVSMVLGLFILFGKEHHVKIQLKGFKVKGQVIKEIYAVGLPAIVMQAIGSVMLLGVNGILAGISETGVAVLGIYQRLQSFVFMPVFGLNQGTLPIMGYNYGARDKKRLMGTFKFGLLLSMIIMGLGCLVFQLVPGVLLNIFNPSEEMYTLGTSALRLISICFIPAAYGIMASSMFQATGYGLLSMFASLIRQLVGILPIAFILGKAIGITGVWMAFPLAEILGSLYAIFVFRWLYKKKIKNLEVD